MLLLGVVYIYDLFLTAPPSMTTSAVVCPCIVGDTSFAYACLDVATCPESRTVAAKTDT